MELTATMFEQIIGTLRTAPVSGEQRRHPRVGLRAKTTLYVDQDGQLSPNVVPAWIKDLSPYGIGLISEAPLAPGASFELRLSGRQGIALVVRYVVVRSRTVGSQHSVGGQLTEVVDTVAAPAAVRVQQQAPKLDEKWTRLIEASQPAGQTKDHSRGRPIKRVPSATQWVG